VGNFKQSLSKLGYVEKLHWNSNTFRNIYVIGSQSGRYRLPWVNWTIQRVGK